MSKDKIDGANDNKALKRVIIALIILVIICAVIGAVYYYIKYQSLKDLQQKAAADQQNENIIIYNNDNYRYKDNMINLLGIGVDKTGEIATENIGLENGQADTLFLLAIDPDKKTADIIAINRNTMTTYDVYSLSTGQYVGRQKAQITLSYGYGGGGEHSCQATVKAVSELLHNIPISGYYALNKEAIIPLNDAVNGVTVNLDDGTAVTLNNSEALQYVSNRNTDEFDSATKRLEHQKNYVLGFITAAKNSMKNNSSLPLDIYDIIKQYSITSITNGELLSLANTLAGFDKKNIAMHSLPGTTKTGEVYEEYYVDDTALLELVVSIFYEKVPLATDNSANQ